MIEVKKVDLPMKIVHSVDALLTIPLFYQQNKGFFIKKLDKACK